ncbi:MAG: YdcF family protein, partial [Planctomycetota bacterium]
MGSATKEIHVLRRVLHLSRPMAIALGVFTFLNLLIAIQDSNSSATRVWLNLDIPEPALSVFGALLGIALILPHSVCHRPSASWVLGGVVFGFCILVGANVIGYYHRLQLGLFRTNFPVPFSLLILAVLLCEFARVSWWAPAESKLPRPAWVFLRGILVSVSFFFLISIHIVTFGVTDYRRSADAAVILGARVDDGCVLSPALRHRVDTGIQLYKEGLVTFLIMSGGMGPNGVQEPECMAKYAQR